MLHRCPYCLLNPTLESPGGQVNRAGRYYRKSDGRSISRFLCRSCGKTFSHAIHAPEFRQNKRHLNFRIFKLLSSGVFLRRLAIVLGISRTTVNRKLIFLAKESAESLRKFNQAKPKAHTIEFDDIETFEHAKAKALSILVVVESRSRRILSVQVARMPSKSRKSNKLKIRYGKRNDERRVARQNTFARLQGLGLVEDGVIVKSDKCPSYVADVKKYFPGSEHRTFKGRRAAITGYGELKRGPFDPLFSINHTAASLRDSIKRLAKQTWCTTKKRERLLDALTIYSDFHNTILLKKHC